MKIDVKITIILVLSGLSLLFYYERQQFKELYVKNLEAQVSSYSSDAVIPFRLAFEAIEALEKEDVLAAKGTLYSLAAIYAPRISVDDVPAVTAEPLNRFNERFPLFLEEQCDLNNYDACSMYGDWAEERQEYDLAHAALLKSAENGNLWAMSSLVDLYRNKNWPQHSEDQATEWLHRIGEIGRLHRIEEDDQ